MKTILIFDSNGTLLKQIPYRTKRDAERHYKLFKKKGHIDVNTGLFVNNCIYELI